ncbi:MAG: RluA family pseudouridine synthase [Alistipes sp.]|nr:RluA family pseudouridine synthase [Alistipes sp.]
MNDRHPTLHRFSRPTDGIALPGQLNNPFRYEPHPLCRLAAAELRDYLATRPDWREEIAAGKMFGVLVVRDPAGDIGFLAAFSGNLAGENRHAYFVPPIYDMLRPEGLFRREEAAISAINRRIGELENAPDYRACREELARAEADAAARLTEAKQRMEKEKARRDARRAAAPGREELEALLRQSQHQKAELKRLKQRLAERNAAIRSRIEQFEQPIAALRTERRSRSAALQHELFRRFRICDRTGVTRDLCEIFAPTAQGIPPAGAGECAAPKLLQYAFTHRLEPLALAEFWRGASPKGELRRDGCYYPACRGKCGPILRYMLGALAADPEPERMDEAPAVRYEDDCLAVVVKPAGMLTVPGTTAAPSVLSWARERYPEATGPLIVHRLDMDTSGLLVLAKTEAAHRKLQEQFRRRTVGKRYVALLDGVLPCTAGRIELPLRPDPYDRPRQRVDPENGKPAVTEYTITGVRDGRTRVVFRPVTGRTHQLRVHAAHPEGLDAPIAGDRLYGRADRRLFLHAVCLEFVHPTTGATIRIEEPEEF